MLLGRKGILNITGHCVSYFSHSYDKHLPETTYRQIYFGYTLSGFSLQSFECAGFGPILRQNIMAVGEYEVELFNHGSQKAEMEKGED
jgi:hypothetical protein